MSDDRITGVDGSILSCKQIEKLSSAYVDGELSPSINRSIEAHISNCEECSLLIEDIQRILRFAKSLKNTRMPAGVRSRLRKALEEKTGHSSGDRHRTLRLVKPGKKGG